MENYFTTFKALPLYLFLFAATLSIAQNGPTCPNGGYLVVPADTTGENCGTYVNVVATTTGTECGPLDPNPSNTSPYASVSNSLDASGIYPVGRTTFNFVLGCETGGICEMVVEVLAPPVQCNLKDTTLYLVDSNPIVVPALELDLGTTDGCSSSISLTGLKEQGYSCGDVGVIQDTVTAIGAFETSVPALCPVTITVVDTIKPVCNIVPKDTVYLDANGIASLNPAQLDLGSTDNCGIASITADRTTFTCNDVDITNSGFGQNVTVRVTDINGNSSDCPSSIVVLDTIAPVCTSKDTTVVYQVGGTNIVYPYEVDGGSSDNCTVIPSRLGAYDGFLYDCSHIGTNTMNLGISDLRNTTFCPVTITVLPPSAAPTCSTKDATIYVDDTGVASLTPQDIDNGSSTACGTPILSVSQNTFGCSYVTTQTAQWENVGSAGFSADNSIYQSLAIDSNNQIYAAFSDGTNGNKTTVMTYVNSVWIPVGNPGFSTGIAWHQSLVIDSNNQLFVAYRNRPGDNISIMTFDGNDWIPVGNQIFSTNRGGDLSLAIDVNDQLYIAYSDYAIGQKCTVMKYNGTNWTPLGNPGFSIGVAQKQSLAINSNGQVFVAYQDRSIGNKTTVMTYDGSSWNPVGNIGFSSGASSFQSLAINSNNQLFVAYRDESQSGKTTVMTYDGSSWNPVGNIGFSSGDSNSQSLAINSNNQLFVAYRDRLNGSKTSVLEYNGSSWTPVGNLGFSAGSAGYQSLATDSNNNLFVAFRDSANGAKTTVMTYQKTGTPVTLTVSDAQGNSSSCEAMVTVLDTIAPKCMTKDATVYLDADGRAILTPDLIDNGSSDNCSAVELTIDRDTFSCSDIVSTTPTCIETFDNEPITPKGQTAGNWIGTNAQVQIAVDPITGSNVIQGCDGGGASWMTNVTDYQIDWIANYGSCNLCFDIRYNNGNPANPGVGYTTIRLFDDNGNPSVPTPLGANHIAFVHNTGISNTWQRVCAPIALSDNGVLPSNSEGYWVESSPGVFDQIIQNTHGLGVLVDFAGGSNTSEELFLDNICIESCHPSVNLTVTDASGNSSTCTSNVTVLDTLPPVCPSGSDIVVQLEAGQCDTLFSFVLPTATDNCDASPVSSVIAGQPASGDRFAIGVHPVEYEVTDTYGNRTTCSFNIEIKEYVPDGLSCEEEINFSLDPTTCRGTLVPEMLVKNQIVGCLDACAVTIKTLDGKVRNSEFTYDDVGKKFHYEFCCGGVCCWGVVNVEYKAIPSFECPTTVLEVSCDEVENFAPPRILNNCSGAEAILVQETVENIECDPDYIQEVRRQWRVRTHDGKDKGGICEQVIKVRRLDISAIRWPTNRMMPRNPLSCPSSIDPSVTGAPYLGNTNLHTNTPTQCNILTTYTDIELPVTGCVKKYLRTWRVKEWHCSDPAAIVHNQMIEVADTEGPTLTDVPQDRTISTSGHDCNGTTRIVLPKLDDKCNLEGARIDINTPNRAYPGYTNELIQLPIGVNTIDIHAFDGCGNRTDTSFTITVVDQTAPVTVCLSETTIALSIDTVTTISAKAFNKGTYDECGLKTLVVRRMDPSCHCYTPEFDHMTYKGSYAGRHYYTSNHSFSYPVSRAHAQALGGQILDMRNQPDSVVQWIREGILDTNKDGKISVDDTVFFTQDNAIYSEAKFIMELSETCGFSSYVGFCCQDAIVDDVMVVLRAIDYSGNYNDCMVTTKVVDKIAPSIKCPEDMQVDCDTPYDRSEMSATFGSAQIIDNCTNTHPVEVVEEVLNSCRIGYITRSFTVAGNDGKVSASCTQRIDLIAKTPFDGNSIEWPQDVTVEECTDAQASVLSPDSLGIPGYVDGSCSLVGHRYDDEIYTFNNSTGPACLKILRKWQVIDWCNKNSKGEYAQWTHTQTIKVVDQVAPEFTVNCEDKTVCTYDSSCKNGYIELKVAAMDACTDTLNWTYKVDINSSGTFDSKYTTSGRGDTIDASGSYPIGKHIIEYTYADRCGNIASCTQNFEIINCKAPTPYCQGVTMALSPTQASDGSIHGSVELWASDLNSGSFHPCNYDLIYSFEPVTANADGSLNVVSARAFTCDDVGTNKVRMYAAVEISKGNVVQDFCITDVIIQDNQVDTEGDSICSGSFNSISGTIYTGEGRRIAETKVQLIGSESTAQMTTEVGAYAFASVPMGGNYTILPEKDDVATNGVNTRDLIAIQRHLLGLQKITSPYQLIAADADADGSISPRDLLLIRKVILRLTDGFENNKKWRFVDKSYAFETPERAFSENFPEAYLIDSLSSSMAVDFVGVKTADVNESARLSFNESNATTTRNIATLSIDEVHFEAGQTLSVPVAIQDIPYVAGFQYTMEYDDQKLKLVDVNSDRIKISHDHIGVFNNGLATISWNTDTDMDIRQEQTLFYLVFETLQPGQLSTSMSVNSLVTEAELYTVEETYQLGLRIDNAVVGARSKFVLHQNVPNPFNRKSNICVDIPEATTSILSITDVTGRIVHKRNIQLIKGNNCMEVFHDQLSGKGVYYYTIKAGPYSATKKMVVLD